MFVANAGFQGLESYWSFRQLELATGSPEFRGRLSTKALPGGKFFGDPSTPLTFNPDFRHIHDSAKQTKTVPSKANYHEYLRLSPKRQSISDAIAI